MTPGALPLAGCTCYIRVSDRIAYEGSAYDPHKDQATQNRLLGVTDETEAA